MGVVYQDTDTYFIILWEKHTGLPFISRCPAPVGDVEIGAGLGPGAIKISDTYAGQNFMSKHFFFL